ncbi:hypothetical protein PVAP13_2NG192803 [Panicum virgatum]|uniref:Uncharacterized protein n=1 Tax=Panicum virgatum TaxID=38727 RepID=A0A8T0VS16_PANVG|nr:hypothetical protein PVAP13_2NG192803 [Panicum virgatum]
MVGKQVPPRQRRQRTGELHPVHRDSTRTSFAPPTATTSVRRRMKEQRRGREHRGEKERRRGREHRGEGGPCLRTAAGLHTLGKWGRCGHPTPRPPNAALPSPGRRAQGREGRPWEATKEGGMLGRGAGGGDGARRSEYQSRERENGREGGGERERGGVEK